MFRGVRIFLKGLSDTFEHLLQFFVLTVGWWIGVLTIVFAPGATVALFAAVDPRIGSTFDRPGLRAFLAAAVRNAGRGWKVALIVLPILGLLTYNLWYYGSREDSLVIFAPAWFVLLVLGAIIALSALSIAALLEEPPLSALKASAILTGARLPHALVVLVCLVVLIVIGSVLIVPVVMFLPATVAATVNRLVLDGLKIPIPDPLAPTDERLVEEAIARERKKLGP
jgi:uncharacterized membrane protein YesL